MASTPRSILCTPRNGLGHQLLSAWGLIALMLMAAWSLAGPYFPSVDRAIPLPYAAVAIFLASLGTLGVARWLGARRAERLRLHAAKVRWSLCFSCGYQLPPEETGVCPECGSSFAAAVNAQRWSRAGIESLLQDPTMLPWSAMPMPGHAGSQFRLVTRPTIPCLAQAQRPLRCAAIGLSGVIASGMVILVLTDPPHQARDARDWALIIAPVAAGSTLIMHLVARRAARGELRLRQRAARADGLVCLSCASDLPRRDAGFCRRCGTAYARAVNRQEWEFG